VHALLYYISGLALDLGLTDVALALAS